MTVLCRRIDRSDRLYLHSTFLVQVANNLNIAMTSGEYHRRFRASLRPMLRQIFYRFKIAMLSRKIHRVGRASFRAVLMEESKHFRVGIARCGKIHRVCRATCVEFKMEEPDQIQVPQRNIIVDQKFGQIVIV